jgi:hypothetical protein
LTPPTTTTRSFDTERRNTDAHPYETRIERVPVDAHLADRISEWKTWKRYGWQVTALIAPDERTVLVLACRTRIRPRR